MAAQMDPSATPHRAALEHPRDVLLGDLLTTRDGARRAPVAAFQRAVEDGDRQRRRGDADRRDQQRRHAQKSESDQPDQERREYGGVKTFFGARAVHAASPAKVPLTGGGQGYS